MVILLSATLFGQAKWFLQRDRVLQNHQVRPWLEWFCHTFSCTLPPTRDLNSFQMLEHVAQVHPDISEAIHFELTFINNATFPQPYPDLQLTFENINGKPIAQRRFKATEYLQPPVHDQMQARASVHVSLDLVEMANMIDGDEITVGYHFEFF